MNKRIYAVQVLQSKKDLSIGDQTIPLEMSWADGMIGVMPVFDSLEAAEGYARDKYQIIELEVED